MSRLQSVSHQEECVRVGRSGDIKNFIPIAINEYDLIMTHAHVNAPIYTILLLINLFFDFLSKHIAINVAAKKWLVTYNARFRAILRGDV